MLADPTGCGIERDWKRGTFEESVFRRRAAGFCKSCLIRLHGLLLLQPAKRLLKNLGGSKVRRHDDAIVHPLAFPPGRDDPDAPQIGEMTGNLRLRTSEDFDKVANTDFLITHQIQ